MRRHGELTGSKHPPRTLLRRRPRRSQGMALVAGGVRCRQPARIRVIDVDHAQGQEDALFQQVDQRHTADLLHDAARDHIVGVGVLPLGAGVEIERPFAPHIQDVLSGCGRQHGRHHVVLRPVVLVAGGVGKQHAERYFAGARELGQVLRHRIVQAQLALLRQQTGQRQR